MKKILLIIILCLTINSVCAEYFPDTNKIVIPISKGWNLMPPYVQLAHVNSTVKLNDFKWGYLFDRSTQEYVLCYRNGRFVWGRFGPEDVIERFDLYIIQSSMWGYSTKEGQITYDWVPVREAEVIDEYFGLDKYALNKGWNLIFLTPEFVGKSFNSINGTCSIERAYFWLPEENNWSPRIDLSFTASNIDVGKSMVLKVTDNCNMTEIKPPQLPKENE